MDPSDDFLDDEVQIQWLRRSRIKAYFNLFLLYVLLYTIEAFVITIRIKYYDPEIFEYSLVLPLLSFIARFVWYLVKKFKSRIEAVEVRCLLEMFFAGNLSIF